MPLKIRRLLLPGALVLIAAVSSWGVTVKITATPAGATVVSETGQRLASPASFDVKRRD